MSKWFVLGGCICVGISYYVLGFDLGMPMGPETLPEATDRIETIIRSSSILLLGGVLIGIGVINHAIYDTKK